MHSVVIVDDHPAIRLAVRSVLEGSGLFKVVGDADSGPAALTIIRDLQPSLAILDLDLPRMNGLELIERLKTSNPTLKVLVLSGQQESIFATRALHAGANGFMSKSEDMASIVQASQSVLSGYSVFPSGALTSLTGPVGTSPADLVKSLSDRELSVLQHLARGLSNKEIGDMLLISNKTVSSYKTRLFEKLNISTLVELVDFARANGLIT
ncbi:MULTISPECIES: response regulator transcription factor [unclassified Variovorax]|uniref:response regulator transcription factor n=1 Tax=unclassified Variovorax TaxID=663243 RepID=UPI001BD1C8DF|nr:MULTISPECIES: response regulator transcription factor [unclassified Variovorax]